MRPGAYRRVLGSESPSDQEAAQPDRGTGLEVRAAELIAALCLATDLGTELPFEHGLRSTLVAMRLAERVGVDSETAAQTYYGCLLFHAGCTAEAELSAELFDEGAPMAHLFPVMFGTRGRCWRGSCRRWPARTARPRCGRCGTRIWQRAGPLTPDEWERVRLHAYHSERVLCRSPFLAALAPVGTCHHERLDGSGYHRGSTGAAGTAAGLFMPLLNELDGVRAFAPTGPGRG